MMQERRLSAEIENFEKPKNSLRVLRTSIYIDKTERYHLRRSSGILCLLCISFLFQNKIKDSG